MQMRHGFNRGPVPLDISLKSAGEGKKEGGAGGGGSLGVAVFVFPEVVHFARVLPASQLGFLFDCVFVCV